MKRIVFAFLLMFACLAIFAPTSVCNAQVQEDTFVVTANVAVVYAAPDFSSAKIATLSHNSTIKLEMGENGATLFAHDGFNFNKTQTKFQFEESEVVGFVLADLLTPQSDMLQSIPNFNAKTNASCKVLFKEENQFVESDILLEKGEKLFLYEGFDSKSEFTAISFLKDNQVRFGFLQTKYIKPNGINPLLITCGIVVLAVLGIVFAWLFMRGKNKSALKRK